MPCTYCGAHLARRAKFCPRCGVPTNVRAEDPTPAAVDWNAVRQSRYAMLLKFASAICDRELTMEAPDQFEARGARTLNLFFPDRTPVFSITSRDGKPLFEKGRWTPIHVRTSHRAFIDAARRLAEEYHRQTRMRADVMTPT